jgi:hypothetical protein
MCKAIDRRALAGRLVEMGAMQLDDNTTASQEGAKLKKPSSSSRQHHWASSDDGIDSPATIITITSSITNNTDDDISTFQKGLYKQYKRTSSLSSGSCCGALEDAIEESVHFCNFFFLCEIFGVDDHYETDNNKNNKVQHGGVGIKSKAERMKEMNDTFLGKMIQCESIGIGSCRRDDCERGDYSGGEIFRCKLYQ